MSHGRLNAVEAEQTRHLPIHAAKRSGFPGLIDADGRVINDLMQSVLLCRELPVRVKELKGHSKRLQKHPVPGALENVAVTRNLLSLLDVLLIVAVREEYDRKAVIGEYGLGGLRAVHTGPEAYVHENQVDRAVGVHGFDCGFSALSRGNPVACLLQELALAKRHQSFIFYKQDAALLCRPMLPAHGLQSSAARRFCIAERMAEIVALVAG